MKHTFPEYEDDKSIAITAYLLFYKRTFLNSHTLFVLLSINKFIETWSQVNNFY